MSLKANVYVSYRREYEFGIALGMFKDWVDERRVWSIRFSFGKRSLVFAFRRELRDEEQ